VCAATLIYVRVPLCGLWVLRACESCESCLAAKSRRVAPLRDTTASCCQMQLLHAALTVRHKDELSAASFASL